MRKLTDFPGLPGWNTISALIGAAAVAVVSLFIIELLGIAGSESLATQAAVGYAPVLLGCVSMWLCYRAYRRATRKKLVVAYAVLLAPFAFSYPAWIVFLWRPL